LQHKEPEQFTRLSFFLGDEVQVDCSEMSSTRLAAAFATANFACL